LIEKARELSEKYNQECIPVPCDLSSMDGIDEFVNQISEKEDAIDFLVNNAGAAWGEPLESFSEKGWDKVMDLNVKSIFFLTQKFKNLLSKNASDDEWNCFIHFSSFFFINLNRA
jgi:NAD(P)-dependent dehydrogenase (short-subunit alcohol dehydrogenase family)